MEEEEGAAGFGEDFFKNRIRLLTFIFTAVSLISYSFFIVNSTVNLTSILSLLLSLGSVTLQTLWLEGPASS